MFIEKKLLKVLPRFFTANGTAEGLVTVSDVSGFFVKQQVSIQATGRETLFLEIKRVISNTQFYVGPKGNINNRTDLSAYLLSNMPNIQASEQDRPTITLQDHERAVYVEEPVVAKRSILVDELGRYYNDNNPLPVEFGSGATESLRILNLNLVLSNTNYILTLPDKTRRFEIKLRDNQGPLRFYDPINTAEFITIPKGAVYSNDAILPNNFQITVQSSQANSVLEVLAWVQNM